MRVEKFKVEKKGKLISVIASKFSNLSQNLIRSILKNKDIKVDGVRAKENVEVDVGQEITFFVKDNVVNVSYEIVFEDENILIANKPQGIETVSADGNDFLSALAKFKNQKLFAVHRLDRNTMGLVVFAKNLDAKSELDESFKKRTIHKRYLALVYGCGLKAEDEMIAYLKKDADKSLVFVSDKNGVGFEKIQTNYKVVEEYENSTLVDVELITGKTHQIRAHFAHIGHFVIGDEKYGDSKINKLFHKKKQCLCSYKLTLNFEDGLLSYLDRKDFELDKTKIDFVKNCKNK